eukprot:TRINITY_DN16425_c0_g1_i2.p1 TRINITY_DN16425_c0_g1~~TRINITY_DN16425_c0_g1_i2.p1  ORF type:complete len:878 (-),score=193.10 TRINITY_DN16425_c0_g1_i2:104-2716(-)
MHRSWSQPCSRGVDGAAASSKVFESDGERVFDRFEGEVILVDLATASAAAGKKVVHEQFEGRAWVEDRLKSRATIGFDIEWRPDRSKDADNAVALLQLADDKSALLLRTHRTGRWLPSLVIELLTSARVRKACIGFDGNAARKMRNSFGIEVHGVVAVEELAAKKGCRHSGLKALAEEVGWRIRKEGKIARSDWEAPSLTPEQIAYAAEDAHFTFLLFDALESAPELPASGADIGGTPSLPELQTTLSLKPGWTEKGIYKTHLGIWCSLCNKGPMLQGDVVERHLESKVHTKKALASQMPSSRCSEAVPNGDPTDETLMPPQIIVPPEFQARGITVSDGCHTRVPRGELFCSLCDAGPFLLQAAEAHLGGRLHLKREAKARDDAQARPELTLPLQQEGITIVGAGGGSGGTDGGSGGVGQFYCTTCDAGPFVDNNSLGQHLRGKGHQKKRGKHTAQDFPGASLAVVECADEAMVEEEKEKACSEGDGLFLAVLRRDMLQPPDGWNASNFLFAAVGATVCVRMVEDGFAWASLVSNGARGNTVATSSAAADAVSTGTCGWISLDALERLPPWPPPVVKEPVDLPRPPSRPPPTLREVDDAGTGAVAFVAVGAPEQSDPVIAACESSPCQELSMDTAVSSRCIPQDAAGERTGSMGQRSLEFVAEANVSVVASKPCSFPRPATSMLSPRERMVVPHEGEWIVGMRAVLQPLDGFDASNFLTVQLGDEFLVLHVDRGCEITDASSVSSGSSPAVALGSDGRLCLCAETDCWLWCRRRCGDEGWVPLWAVAPVVDDMHGVNTKADVCSNTPAPHGYVTSGGTSPSASSGTAPLNPPPQLVDNTARKAAVSAGDVAAASERASRQRILDEACPVS